MDEYNIYCSSCWSSKCIHWKRLCEGTTISCCFGLCWHNNYQYSIKCLSCSRIYNPVPRSTYSLLNCDCKSGHGVFYSTSNFYDEYLKEKYGKYLRCKCPYCKGSGKIKHNTFIPCDSCKGSGGLACTTCKQTGTIWVTEYQRGVNRTTPRDCNCNKGFKDICIVCNG